MELKDSLSELELQKWGKVVMDDPTPSMTSIMTSHNPFQFWGTEWAPPSIHARRDMEDPRQLPRGCKLGCVAQGTLKKQHGAPAILSCPYHAEI